jgi:hypothetical protein
MPRVREAKKNTDNQGLGLPAPRRDQLRDTAAIIPPVEADRDARTLPKVKPEKPGGGSPQTAHALAPGLPPIPEWDFDRLPDSALLRAVEAAGYLRLSVITLTDWRRTGRGPPWITVAGRPRYKVGAIRAYQENEQSNRSKQVEAAGQKVLAAE